MPTSTNVTNLRINTLTEAQYDTAVQGGVIGQNELSIITDLDTTIQVSTMPTASATEEGNIYQYIGTTNANYTNGYFYKCVSDGQNPVTYSWTAIQVQASSGGLPSQTGNAGKFLTTDGIDASWSDKPLVNTNSEPAKKALFIGDPGGNISGIGQDSISIISMQTYGGWISTGLSSLAIGTKNSSGNYSINIRGANCSGNYSIAIGYSSSINQNSHNSIAIGRNCIITNSEYAIQLGYNGTNSDANTFKVANANGNFEIMSANGTIPTARLTKVNTTLTLSANGWSSNTQTISVAGITTTGVVLVSPIPTDQADYTSAGIYCSAQSAGSLTFTCSTTPANDIDVVVVML